MRKMIATSRGAQHKTQAYQAGLAPIPVRPDSWVLIPSLLLLAIGIVMVGSASIAVAESQGLAPFHYLVRHGVYVVLGVGLASVFRVVPIVFLERTCRPMLLLAAMLLLLVFVPGLGQAVNGSMRWINLGVARFQVVEAVKLLVVLYMAGYLVRRSEHIQQHFFDTLKPLLLVLNVDEGDVAEAVPADLESAAAEIGTAIVPLSAKVEMEIAQMPEEDRGEFYEELGLGDPARDRFLRAEYELLDLITMLTAGPDECRAWPVRGGSSAPKAAGKIHSDIERGFIRAEVIAYEDFVACNGEQGAKEAGKLRLEGKDYIVRDGDVIHFRFNV